MNGRNSFQRDKAKGLEASHLARARVDVGAILDFASSFGTVVLTRAYADWSARVNAEPRAAGGPGGGPGAALPGGGLRRNGADIRLAVVHAVEDMFRLPDLTHVVIVAGDSDSTSLAQRCKRLGRYVVGIGVAGSSSRALAAACDDFVIYDSPARGAGVRPGRRRRQRPGPGSPSGDARPPEPAAPDPQAAATALLTRALQIAQEKDDVEWLHNSRRSRRR